MLCRHLHIYLAMSCWLVSSWTCRTLLRTTEQMIWLQWELQLLYIERYNLWVEFHKRCYAVCINTCITPMHTNTSYIWISSTKNILADKTTWCKKTVWQHSDTDKLYIYMILPTVKFNVFLTKIYLYSNYYCYYLLLNDFQCQCNDIVIALL